METEKSLIKIEKRHEVRKMERFMNNELFELDQKLKKSYGKHWTVHDYHYSMVIYQFLMSEFSEMSNKINHLYKLIDCEKFKEFNSSISDFKYVDIRMYNMKHADKMNLTNMFLNSAYIELCLINFSDELIYDLTDRRYRFPRCKHFNSKVTHHLNTAIGKFLICYKCVKLTCDDYHADDVDDDYGNLHHLFEDYDIRFFIHAHFKKLPETIGSFLI